MKSMCFLRGMGLGLVVGSVITAAAAPHKKYGKSIVSRALRSVGDMLESITDSIS